MSLTNDHLYIIGRVIVASVDASASQILLGPLPPGTALSQLQRMTITPTGVQPPAFAAAFRALHPLLTAVNSNAVGWGRPGATSNVIVLGADNPALQTLLATSAFLQAKSAVEATGATIHGFGELATRIASQPPNVGFAVLLHQPRIRFLFHSQRCHVPTAKRRSRSGTRECCPGPAKQEQRSYHNTRLVQCVTGSSLH